MQSYYESAVGLFFAEKYLLRIMDDPSPDSLAVRHLWRTFWGGLSLTPPLCLVLALVMFGVSFHEKDAFTGLLYNTTVFTGSVWLFAALPALFFCWLRLPAMRWLFAYYLARPVGRRRALAVLGTLGLVGASIAAGALVLYLWWRAAIEWQPIWRMSTAMSFPWLLAAPGASWWVLRPVATNPAGAPQPG